MLSAEISDADVKNGATKGIKMFVPEKFQRLFICAGDTGLIPKASKVMPIHCISFVAAKRCLMSVTS